MSKKLKEMFNGAEFAPAIADGVILSVMTSKKKNTVMLQLEMNEVASKDDIAAANDLIAKMLEVSGVKIYPKYNPSLFSAERIPELFSMMESKSGLVGSYLLDAEISEGDGIYEISLKNGGKENLLENKMDVEIEKLVNSGFYNGLTFHRVIPGFMIQGGCPEGTGIGGPGWHIKGEFLANGVKNDLKHTRGVLSMARSMMPNSAGSQFFIMHKDAPHLDGDYAAFGKVVEGMDAVDEIAAVETDYSDKPLKPVVMKTVKIV